MSDFFIFFNITPIHFFYTLPHHFFFLFFFNDTATTEIYTLSLHDALPISPLPWRPARLEPNTKISVDTNNSQDRKSTRLNSSHANISYAVFCLDKKSTRLNSSHANISYAVFCLDRKSTRLNSSHANISYAV